MHMPLRVAAAPAAGGEGATTMYSAACGCGADAAAFAKRDAALRHEDAAAARAGKVDVRNFVDAETGGLDSGTRALLSGGTFGVKDQADLSKQELQSQR